LLGIEKVLWASGDLAGDDTDDHIDQLARFVAPG
jgi:agmatine deiminase